MYYLNLFATKPHFALIICSKQATEPRLRIGTVCARLTTIITSAFRQSIHKYGLPRRFMHYMKHFIKLCIFLIEGGDQKRRRADNNTVDE